MTNASHRVCSIVPVFDALREKYGWSLRDVLGHGGSAHVFRESWKGIPCAVKISKNPLALQNTKELERLQRELQAVKELRCDPHILRLVNHSVCMGHLITVWELAEGTLHDELNSVQKLFGDGGVVPQELLRWMDEAARGIDRLNERGIYHRDIKPQNLFLVDGHVKVGDLGFAKFGGASTFSNSITGTLGYVPLEAVQGETKPTIDVFGLAATYVHLRTGRKPFGNDAVTIIERMREGAFEYQGLTGAEIYCLRKALSPDPDERFGTAGQLARELQYAAPARRVHRGVTLTPNNWPQISESIRRQWRRGVLGRWSSTVTLLLGLFLAVWGLLGSPFSRIGTEDVGARPSPSDSQQAHQAAQHGTAAAAQEEPGMDVGAGPPAERRLSAAHSAPSPQMIVRKEPVVIVHVLPRARGVVPPQSLAESDGLVELPFEPPATSPGFEAAQFHPRRRRVLGLSTDGLVTLWNEAGGEPLKTFSPGPSLVTAVAISPDGNTLVAGTNDGTLVLCDPDTGRTFRRLQGHSRAIRSIEFDALGERILSASDDRTVRIWDADRGRCERILSGHTGPVQFASFSPDGLRVVSASADHSSRVWDVRSERLLAILKDGEFQVSGARFLADGQTVITTAWDGNVRIWDVATARVKTILRAKTKVLHSLDVDPTGRRAAIACGDTPLIWEVYTNRARMLGSHGAIIRTVRFDRSGSRLVTSSWDGTIRVWDADNGKELSVLGNAR